MDTFLPIRRKPTRNINGYFPSDQKETNQKYQWILSFRPEGNQPEISLDIFLESRKMNGYFPSGRKESIHLYFWLGSFWSQGNYSEIVLDTFLLESRKYPKVFLVTFLDSRRKLTRNIAEYFSSLQKYKWILSFWTEGNQPEI